MLRDMLRQAEGTIVSATSPEDIKRGMMMLEQCRLHWVSMMNSSLISLEDRDSMFEYDTHLDMLRSRAQEMIERMITKPKKP